MADITVTVPDAVLPRVVDALAVAGGWVQGQGTKRAAAQQALVTFIRQTVRNVEEQVELAVAEEEARDRLRQRPDIDAR